MRKFNTSGPNLLAKHYTLPRFELIERGKDLVYNDRYFTIWAPRQTGKSTYFGLLGDALQAEGYLVCRVGFENYQTDDLTVFMERFVPALQTAWDLDLTGLTLTQVFYKVEQVKDKKLVLIIDEVEGINSEYFGKILHTIRNAYHSRETHG